MYFYEVAPLKVVRQDSNVLTYHSETELARGMMVLVSVGKKMLPGIVWRRVKKPAYATKNIEQVMYSTLLPEPLLKTAAWMSDYYSTHLAGVLQTILPAGIEKKRRPAASGQPTISRKQKSFELNPAQQAALTTIEQAGGKTVLLHGITGAGKTAVYIEYIKKVIARNASAIVLTPEISLTPQLTAELQQHFENVVITHSRLTQAQRHQLWQRLLETKTPTVVVGPRSALFMPLHRLGAIIIDECHEPSFKQEQQPRYTTSRVAKVLASASGAQLILGSATPSISDYHMAGRYGTVAPIHERANSSEPPRIQLVDATQRAHFSRNPLFSTDLLEAIAKQLTQKKQILLFHNRRGTASSALCEKCGWHAACETCMLPMTLHADEGRLRCHLCGQTAPIPPHCPICRHADVMFKGVGTKRLEESVKKLFPIARVARFDADAEAGQALHEQYQAVYDGDIDILIGTQLIAKGLDLPRLGLVGIPQADAGLLLPDFGARERTFQLISQACGRVGRQAHATDIIVQTFYPKDPVIHAAVREDYATFYAAEIAERQRGSYPPFIHLLKLVCAYKTEAGAVRAARALAKELRGTAKTVSVIGPTPAFYERLRGLYRWQIVVKSSDRKKLQQLIKVVPKNWQTELDPHSLLS